MTTLGFGTPTRVPGLLLRPVTWPEEAQLIVDVNNASRLAGGSLFVINVEVVRALYEHLVNSDLAADLRLAEADGRPVAYVRVEWRDENRGDRLHSAALSDDENAHFGVRRGWCENISTRAPWRGRGVASALISRALRALRDRSMTQTALGVDAQNETGALHLYTRMGFREAARETEWRRPLLVDGSPTTEAGA